MYTCKITVVKFICIIAIFVLLFLSTLPVTQKEKRREEVVERKKTLLKKQPGMCAHFMDYKGMHVYNIMDLLLSLA